MLLRLIILLAIITVPNEAYQSCPYPTSILPCKCYNYAYVYVSCKETKRFGDIKRVLTGKFTEPFSLRLVDPKITTFTRGSVHDLKISSLLIQRATNLESFSNDSLLDTRNSLYFFDVDNSSLTSIPGQALNNLIHLKSMSITKSKIIRVIKKEMDRLPKSIKYITLSKNNIQSIERGAFTQLSNLQKIEIEQCGLKTLPSGDWLPSTIKKLYLRKNAFTSLSFESVDNLREVSLHLENNKIQYIPPESEITKFLYTKSTLYLEGNPLLCTCNLQWIPTFKYTHFGVINLSGTCSGGDAERLSKRLQDFQDADFLDC